ETLVVMDHIELVTAFGQDLGDAEAEGQWLGEARRPHHCQFQEIDGVAELARSRRPERIGCAVEVEAGYGCRANARIEFRIRLAREDLDIVPVVDQRSTQVSHVDTLPTAVGRAPVRQ